MFDEKQEKTNNLTESSCSKTSTSKIHLKTDTKLIKSIHTNKDLYKDSLPKREHFEEALSKEEVEIFRKQTAKAVGKFSITSSCLTLPITALLYNNLDIAGSLPSVLDTIKTVLPTVLLWYGSYFSLVNRWKNKQIKENPRIKNFFPRERLKSNFKIFLAGEAIWYTSRVVGDASMIAIANNTLKNTNSTIAIGAVASHALLSFVIYPKFIMPLLHRKLDENKKNTRN